MDYTFQFAEWQNKNKYIRASLYIAQNKHAPWVIMCHGFTSHRIGPNYFFTGIAQYCASHGISVNAFDFGGCGESDGNFSDITITSLCSDLVSAYKYVQKRFSPSRILLLGHSFGGTIAVLTAPSLAIDGLILISPLADTKKHAQSHEHILTHGADDSGCYEYGPHELKINFLKELKESDPVNALSKKVTNNIIFFQGDCDEQISMQESSAYSDRVKELGIEPVYHIIPGADHRYSTVKGRKFLQQTVVTWIKEHVL
jgi:esterase/lipase